MCIYLQFRMLLNKKKQHNSLFLKNDWGNVNNKTMYVCMHYVVKIISSVEYKWAVALGLNALERHCIDVWLFMGFVGITQISSKASSILKTQYTAC